MHWWKSTSTDFPRVGWNVETVIGVSTEPAGVGGPTVYNSGEVAVARNRCVRARNHGLVNIVRLDWRGGHAVPTDGRYHDSWKEHFTLAVNALKDVATIFIVGNEPTIEPRHVISSRHYADAFGSLYANKVDGTMYLAAGPAPFSDTNPPDHDWENDIIWLRNASNAITGLDGWALHTYGSPYLDYADKDGRECVNALCDDPAVTCRPKCGGHSLVGDAGFQRYRELIDEVRTRWASKPVYFTETNTKGFRADKTEDEIKPANSYVTGWIQKTYQEIRHFNIENNPGRANYPPVLCLCWFVDDDRLAEWGETEWDEFALSNGAIHSKLQQAREDFKASDTSTGIVKVESSLGPATADLPAGVTRIAPFIG